MPPSNLNNIKGGKVIMKTEEGATQYEHSLNHAVEFFSKAGSLYTDSGTFYGGEESALSLFQKTWIVDPEVSMKLLFWLRDCRGGAGNRSASRECIRWLAEHDTEWMAGNLHLIPFHGRWDDLRSLFGTKLETAAAKFWATAMSSETVDVLAAKWAKRSDTPIREVLGLDIGDFRRLLASIRSPEIVESKMCSKQWNTVNYEKVPSVAMARYTNAFGRHDEERFEKFKEAVAAGEVEIHAGVLFPHDCVRTAINGDKGVADLQFDALPNFMEGVSERIIMFCDTSGSMDASVAGSSSVQRVHVSQGMALYCSAKMPEDSPFYKKFIGFCSEGKFVNWQGLKFSEAVFKREIFNKAVGATNVSAGLDLILKTAEYFNLLQEYMPTTIGIVSDMQFHQGVSGDGPPVEAAMKRWEDAGYLSPKIIYWNVAGHAGSPATVDSPNTALISGFSPAVMKAVFSGRDFSPEAVMLRALEKYEIIIPGKSSSVHY